MRYWGSFLTMGIIIISSSQAQAGTFKCQVGPKVIYQTAPCAGAEGVEIEIKKRSDQKEAEAAENLERWNKKHAADEAAEKEALRVDREKELREIEVRAALDNVEYQRQQAEAQDKQAGALERGAMPYMKLGPDGKTWIIPNPNSNLKTPGF